MKKLTHIHDAGIYPSLVIPHKAIPQLGKHTDVSPSDFIILFLKQEGQDVSLLRPTIGSYTKAQDYNIKLCVQHGIRKVAFAIIHRN